ncbi:MAG: ribonucleoside-diphosphate reductase, adenosylcobalamin-dependent, partial [Pseudomonadota bacterium]|nr:ribonucleoside-diphosphate reductase, adenosylcobalamin-dependent [Pseudomonadota bacterium]
DMPFPPAGERRLFPGVVAATAAVIRWRCEQLGALVDGGPAPMLDAMFSRDEPRTGTAGTLAWAVDVDNPATGETFTLTMKEVTLRSAVSANAPAGAAPTLVTRPCAVGFSGNYPRALDGLARLLSLDMRVIDPAWIGMKLRKLLNVGEPLGHFMAPLPGQKRQQVWPSTIAYVARLMIHRYAMLGVLDEEGFPLGAMGMLETPTPRATGQLAPQAGRPCPECGNATMIHKDGCDFCTSCGYVGACG